MQYYELRKAVENALGIKADFTMQIGYESITPYGKIGDLRGKVIKVDPYAER